MPITKPLPTIKRMYEIDASKAVHKRLEAFFAFMHYNGGHTATFAMEFDGDRNDQFKIDPPPSRFLIRQMHAIAVGHRVEVATQDGQYYSIPEDRSMPKYYTTPNGLWKVPRHQGREGDPELVESFNFPSSPAPESE